MERFEDHAAEVDVRQRLLSGLAIPAHPLALDAQRKLDERRQRALSRYYLAAGAGGLAVGVHTTQFAIRDPAVGLLRPVLEIAAEEMARAGRPVVRIGGICGPTPQAMAEATVLANIGYDAGLLSLGGLDGSDDLLIDHCRAVAEVIPIIGFYLQPAVGGRVLSHSFWRRFLEIPRVVAIKVAPFNRYQSLDVVRAVALSGRSDVALYTGNDDSIVTDLATTFDVEGKALRFAGGLLGHWAVDTRAGVALLERCRPGRLDAALATTAVAVTDCNAAYFDAAHAFRGCVAGLHEVLRRQGLLAGTWCLDRREGLSPGQSEEIDRVRRVYPHLCDDDFIAVHRDRWLSG
ncbi:MAG: dihydrodipicolinate synthase family protein [Planctomycetota bacterium]|nr:MAG: dihydrodipicolinate synthase family protein [Planctomycetota bacterium]